MENTVGIEMSNTDYHADKSVGSTTFKNYLENPKEAFAKYNGEIKQQKSDALLFGSLIHCLALEPETFNDEFVIMNEKLKEPSERLINAEKPLMPYPDKFLTPSGNLSTSAKVKDEIESYRMANDEFLFATPNEIVNFNKWLEYKDVSVINQDMYDEAKKIADKALDYEFEVTAGGQKFHFTFQEKIDSGSAIMERAFFAYVNEDLTVTIEPKSERSVKLKTKPDILFDIGNGYYIVVDLKSAETASIKDFMATSRHNYHLQEAHYTKVLEANGIKVFKFIFLMAGKNEWSGCQQYELDVPTKELGVEHWEKAVKMHILAVEDGEVRETVFDGEKYDREPVVSYPNYMFYK